MRLVEINFTIDYQDIDPGAAPVLQWIEIAKLVVDDRYQRPLARTNWNQIRRIAQNFSWSMFSAVFVAPIEGGKFAIIDGQHRTHAALACGIESVPCLIVQADRAQQARAFAAVNGMVTKVSPLHIFHAQLAGGNEDAIKLNDLVRSCGFRIRRTNNSASQKKFGDLYAISTIKNIVKTFGEDTLSATLLALKYAETCTRHEHHHASLLSGLAGGFARNRELCTTPTIISDRIDALGVMLDELNDEAATQAKAMRRRGGTISSKARLADLLLSKLFSHAKEVAV